MRIIKNLYKPAQSYVAHETFRAMRGAYVSLLNLLTAFDAQTKQRSLQHTTIAMFSKTGLCWLK
jgi:hypothetical protein